MARILEFRRERAGECHVVPVAVPERGERRIFRDEGERIRHRVVNTEQIFGRKMQILDRLPVTVVIQVDSQVPQQVEVGLGKP